MKKPKILYRGIILNYDMFKEFDLKNQSLIVPYEPIIDGLGRKVTTSGNEYGVYTTSDKDICYKLYGSPHNVGKVLDYTLQSNGIVIDVPDIGIVYEINTDNLDVRQPFKTNDNNTDWIIDTIPSSNYKVIRIKIGEDFLHSSEEIDVDNNIDDIKLLVINKLEERIKHLQLIIPYLKGLPIITIREIGKHKDEQIIYRYIYGYDGAEYSIVDNINTSSSSGIIKYLFTSFYKENKNNTIPLKYVISLENKVLDIKEKNKVKAMINIVVDDINDAKRRRDNSLKRGKDVTGFDEKIKMLHQVLETIKKGLEQSEHIK